MPAVIDSAPECVTKVTGTEAERVDDSADFVLGANYEECAGFMTFGPGSTYGAEGEAATTAYYILTWLGITAMVLALLAWVIFENRRLIAYHAARVGGRIPRGESASRWRR
jgi:hypothetical protein